VVNDGPEATEELLSIFGEVAEWVYDHSGIEMPPDQIRFETHTNRRGRTSVQGRIPYRGPRLMRRSLPRVKLDITSEEIVVRPPECLPIAHPYPDDLGGDGRVLAYAYVEIFAEKIRALAERLRPRDLYDVVNLFRRSSGKPPPDAVHEVLAAKCAFKGIPVPSASSLESDEGRSELEAEWANMLAHQLPALPPLEHFWLQLRELFAWLQGAAVPAQMAPIPWSTSEEPDWVPPPTVSTWGFGVPLESIRYAAANYLCVKLRYQGSTRLIEPYSLRRTHDGHLLVHAIRVDNREHRSYRVDRIQGIEVTSTGFTPVYSVEFAAT
jgi:hypothetical protein